jgi:hypothetical protein
MQSKYTAITLGDEIGSVLRYFKLRESFSYAITNNASKNATYLDLLSDELFIDARKHYVRCIGYVINLVA